MATLPAGSRITDYVSLGVITKTLPLQKVKAILRATGKTGLRQRDLPAHVVVCYVIALALYRRASCREVLRCLLEGRQWLPGPNATVKAAGQSGISQARTRLGAEPLKRLYEEVAAPIATAKTVGAWYRAWRLVSLEGSTLDVADTAANEEAFGRPAASRGLMHEAALEAGEDPDRLSLVHPVRVIRRRLPRFVAIPPSAQASL